jgi:hypothetical protein
MALTETDIKNLGFFAEMFRCKNPAEFTTLVTAHIARQESILKVRLGDALFASSDPEVANLVERASECLVAAELINVRITIKRAQIAQSGVDVSVKDDLQQRKEYLDEAEKTITRLSSGASPDVGDYAGGVLETSHFDGITLPVGGAEALPHC